MPRLNWIDDDNLTVCVNHLDSVFKLGIGRDIIHSTRNGPEWRFSVTPIAGFAILKLCCCWDDKLEINYKEPPQQELADAILDRLVNSSHRIDLKGESLRKGILKNE